MYYNPYESREAKKRRIVSNIAIVVILALMVLGIVLLLIPSGSQKRYDFDPIKTVELTAEQFNEGESEFKALIDSISSSSNITVGDSFNEKFPTCTALLSLDESIYQSSDAVYADGLKGTPDVPYVKIGGGYITLAQAVVSTEKDCRDLLIISYKADVKKRNGTVNITLNDYSCYTVRYNTRNPQIPLKLLVGEQSSLLDMFKIRISAVGENPVSAGYELTLNNAFDAVRARENLYHHMVFDPINETYGTAEIITNEQTTDVMMTQQKNALIKNENELAYELKPSDKKFKLLQYVNLKFAFESDDVKLVLTFN